MQGYRPSLIKIIGWEIFSPPFLCDKLGLRKIMIKPFFSWILPIKNESLSLSQLISEVASASGKKSFEIIAVNDASVDNSLSVLRQLQKIYPQLKIINFMTHIGKWAALSAGFKKAKADILITIDSDLQDDPAQVSRLLSRLNHGHDIVSGWRRHRKDPYYKIWLSDMGSKLLGFRDLNSSFKIYRRQVLDVLPQAGTTFRFSLLFARKMGYKIAEVPIRHRPRLYGKSKFGIIKYTRILYDLSLILLLFSGSGRLTPREKS